MAKGLIAAAAATAGRVSGARHIPGPSGEVGKGFRRIKVKEEGGEEESVRKKRE